MFGLREVLALSFCEHAPESTLTPANDQAAVVISETPLGGRNPALGVIQPMLHRFPRSDRLSHQRSALSTPAAEGIPRPPAAKR